MDLCFWPHQTIRIFSFESKELKYEIVGSVCVVYPTEKIPKFIYRCDNKFHLDDVATFLQQELKTETTSKHILAVALVSGCKCEFYAITCLDEKYTKNELIHSFEENLPNKHRRGGQSSARFGRIHDQTVERYAKKIAETMTELYKNQSVYKLILAGPAEIKHKVCLYLSPTFCKFKPILHDTAEIVESTLIEVLDKHASVLSDMRNQVALYAISQFENYVIREPDILVFGKESIAAFKEGRLQTLFVEGKMNTEIDPIKSKCNIVVLPLKYEFCKRYGSMCGILYYSASNSDSLDYNM